MSDYDELFDEVHSNLIHYLKKDIRRIPTTNDYSFLINDIQTYFEPFDVDVNIEIDEEDKYKLNVEVNIKGIII